MAAIGRGGAGLRPWRQRALRLEPVRRFGRAAQSPRSDTGQWPARWRHAAAGHHGLAADRTAGLTPAAPATGFQLRLSHGVTLCIALGRVCLAKTPDQDDIAGCAARELNPEPAD